MQIDPLPTQSHVPSQARMDMFFVNSDISSNNGISYHPEWIRRGIVVTSGDARYRNAISRIKRGDSVLVYVNGVGVVAVGVALDNRVQDVSGDQTVSPTEAIEYHKHVKWELDLRNNPIERAELIRLIGWGPVQSVQRVHQRKEQMLQKLTNLQLKPTTQIEHDVRRNDKSLGQRRELEDNKMKNHEDEELEFDTPLEEEVESIDVSPSTRNIYTEVGDPEIESLHGKFKRGKLIVQADFQRQFVWDTAKASRLIESALLGIPIPMIYLSQEPDNKEYVIDGQQRLTSFFSFIDQKFPDGTDFKLSSLKVFRELNGKKYSGLSDTLQDAIRYFKVRTITFKRESEPNLKFEMFERLNTGSVSLNDQELRNCIYRGQFNALLRELSVDPDFTALLGLKKPDKRMKDIELVLRFAAFHHATYLNYKSPMKNFLNTESEKYRHLREGDAQQLKAAFKNACQITRSMFGANAFKRFYKGDDKNPSGRWEPKKFNASLYDIVMYTMAREDKNVIYQNLDAVREALINLMSDSQEFIDAIELSTSSVQAITKRFDLWRMALQEVVGVRVKEPRCFSRELKEALFKRNDTCAICEQRIQEIDDSAIDHIKQYWSGGRTIPENARLTHRYCNWARSRKD